MSDAHGPGGLEHRLALDLQATQSPVHADRGVARYTKEQARALRRLGVVEALLLNPSQPFPKHLDEDLLTAPELAWSTMSELRRAARRSPEPLAYHAMSPFEISPWVEADVPPHVVSASLPLITTLYDLIPLLHAERYLVDRRFERRYRARVEWLASADLTLTISQHTRRDAIEHLGLAPDRVVSVGAGVSAYFSPATADDDPLATLARHLPEVRAPFVFTLAGGDPRKNSERLIEAWGRVPPSTRGRRQLVVRSDVDDATLEAWHELARVAGLAEGDLVVIGWISDEVLRALYRSADLFVFPPLYEGFGLPVAEAIACGCPAITSSTSSMPEVLDWDGSTFDPTDVDEMAGAIDRGLADEGFRDELTARGAARVPTLTWEAVAERTVAAVGSRLASLRPPPGGWASASAPVRIALVGPMPPVRSGIADYNGRLAPVLAHRCELDVFSPTRRPAGLDALDAGWFPVRALGRTANPWSYDAIVYTVGNSDDHHDLYDLAQELPGILWMHDVRLPGLYLTYARERVPAGSGDAFIRERLLRQYRRRLPSGVEGPVSDAITIPFLHAGLGLSKELVDQARGVIVSSKVADRILRLDQQPDAASTPTWVVPLGAPPVPSGAPGGRAPASAPVVACFGMVAPVKGVEMLITALRTVLAAAPGARLVLVGPVDDVYRSHLEQLADAAGVTAAVTITGHVGGVEYERWLAEVTCAVQLRLGTNGESSAAVLDCLAAGTPVVTNAASATELPEGTVDLVAHDVGAAALGRHLVRLLADPARLASLDEAGRRYAESWTLDDVADRLLELVASLP
ncbi:MAG TPA: glycosyltransferase [Acidimicrobiales bacterium]|nr:glycosyltransferase [Acidimicrobiales bacterium]